MFFLDSSVLLFTLTVSLVVQALFFVLAYTFKTDKFTDFTYSSTFVLLTIYQIIHFRAFSLPQIIIALGVVIWALRLGTYLLTRILRIGKDDRFDDKRGHFLRFMIFWIIQGVTVWAVMIPVSVTLSLPSKGELNPLFLAGGLIWAGGFLMEVISDAQKFRFKSREENRGKWIESGLWKLSRHPNYFGEISLWWGVFLMALSLRDISYWWIAAGPLFITLLILFVSGVPLLEKSADAKYGSRKEYLDYRERTSLLIPWFPRRKGER